MGRKKSCAEREKGICRKQECRDCFPRSFASHPYAVFWSPKNTVQSHEISLNSNKEIWLKCEGCGHHFERVVSGLSKIKKNGAMSFCPFCSGQHRPLCDDETCSHCLARSFAAHPKAKHWHPTKNVNENGKILTPRNVRPRSDRTHWFICDECGHDFDAPLGNITMKPRGRHKPTWCPFCANGPLCDDKNCDMCFENSFAAHPKAIYWDEEKNVDEHGQKLTPRDYRIGSNVVCFFKCGECGHTFDIRLGKVSGKDVRWCHFCGGKRLCKDEDCTWCFERSFASHPRAKHWSKENRRTPRSIRICGKEIGIFNCEDCGGEFEKKIVDVASGGNWCPECVNKTEKKVMRFLRELYPKTTYQFRVNWCRNPETGRHLPFDFRIKNVIIELDGPQHFVQVWNWPSPEKQQERDKYKEERAIENGYTVICLIQTDIWDDRTDGWKISLQQKLSDAL